MTPVYISGGWGKPPVDETGKPLYGDVFGQNTDAAPEPVRDYYYSTSSAPYFHIPRVCTTLLCGIIHPANQLWHIRNAQLHTPIGDVAHTHVL